MATNYAPNDRFARPGVAALAFVVFATAGYSDPQQGNPPIQPPSQVVMTITVSDPEPARPAELANTAGPALVPVRWRDLKDCTSERRDFFFTGLQQLEATVNDQITALTAKRAALRDPSRTGDLDLAIKEMTNARFFLKLTGDGLRRATPQTWDQQKIKVGLAWLRSQEAYRKGQLQTIIRT